jgi:hypothetical protein
VSHVSIKASVHQGWPCDGIQLGKQHEHARREHIHTALTVSEGECRSTMRLWMRISKRSQVLEPSPQGVLRVVMRRNCESVSASNAGKKRSTTSSPSRACLGGHANGALDGKVLGLGGGDQIAAHWQRG